MKTQSIRPDSAFEITDPEWIVLESLDEQTQRFVFDDAVLQVLRLRGLVEPQGRKWRVTHNGRVALSTHNA